MCLMGNEHQRVMVPFLEACSPTYQQIPQKFSKFSTGKLWLTSGFRLGVSEFQTTPEENEGNWLPSAIHQLPFVWFSKCCHSFFSLCVTCLDSLTELDGGTRITCSYPCPWLDSLGSEEWFGSWLWHSVWHLFDLTYVLLCLIWIVWHRYDI